MTSKAKRILCSIALLVVFLTSTASSCTTDPTCDLTGKDTMVTVCVYNQVTGK